MLKDYVYNTEDEVEDPSRTPAFADGVGWAWWHYWGPRATDKPAGNLEVGDFGDWSNGPGSAMAMFAIPRHGSRPRRIPTNHPSNRKLPGAINVTFVDGHAELVKLEKLWELNWHRNWKAPVKRPGL